MEFFKPGLLIDFMRHRTVSLSISAVLLTLSVISIFFPGPNFGIDFAGGTEVQLAFNRPVRSAALRQALEEAGYDAPDVVSVVNRDNEFILRVREVSALPARQHERIEAAVRAALETAPRPEATGRNIELERFSVSPGGDKVTMDLNASVEPSLLAQALSGAGLSVMGDIEESRDHVFEAQLEGVAQEIMDRLRQRFPEATPETFLRAEWVGPRAGQQLRQAAVQSLAYAILIIMLYVAFRFDLRFTPGAVVALAHDALITVGVFVLLQKEFNLTIIAALLTIAGYSINDTIVVYDRIRENMGRYRDRSLYDVINISTSQMLSRTIVTSGTTLLSVGAFFIWGTSVIRDLSFALFIGILIGTYSSIYVAAPLTEWMDRRFFSRARRGRRGRAATASPAV